MNYIEALGADYRAAAPNQARQVIAKRNKRIVTDLLRTELAATKRRTWGLLPLFKRVMGKR